MYEIIYCVYLFMHLCVNDSVYVCVWSDVRHVLQRYVVLCYVLFLKDYVSAVFYVVYAMMLCYVVCDVWAFSFM